jgi:multidrug resistance efflux pump
MEAILLAIYAFFVWLIFFKFKWLPWNIVSQVIVVTIPIVGLTALILTLNVVAPSSHDVRVLKYVVNVLPQVRGRVIEVPAEGNRPMKKGDVLFRIDPTPYQNQVDNFEAQLANAEGSSRELEEQLKGAEAQVAQANARVRQATAQADLARKRVEQNRELVAKGAGNRFDLEQAETNLRDAEAGLDGAHNNEGQALASERQIRQRMGAKVNGEWAQVAQVRAQLENARWELEQTTVLAPTNGSAINLQLRPGAIVAAFPIAPALTFVEDEYTVVALYDQNELYAVKPGDDAEIVLETLPGEIIKAKVDSIIWAQGQGQSPISTLLPQTGSTPVPPGRFPVKLKVDPKFKDVFLAAGAHGEAAIYTEHVEAIQILRKVILRIGTKLNYLIVKLH